ncbi:MAG: hypothetical protein H7Z71_06775 [Moraxellaceae bacterium]|nr:hypothetical protein [Pseudobdellovibrionaceae bacterium]
MIISSVVSALILWSGDYASRIQFDGLLKSEIKGEVIDGNKTCDVYARFDEVVIKEKNQPEKFLKVNFRLICTDTKQQPSEIRLATEMVRASDLRSHSFTVFISNTYKKSSFKIEDYSLTTSKKPLR